MFKFFSKYIIDQHRMLISAIRKFRNLSLLACKTQRSMLLQQTAFLSSNKMMDSVYADFSKSIQSHKVGLIDSQTRIDYQKIKPVIENNKFIIKEKLPKPSNSVIFFKQHYEKLFYNKASVFPNLNSISFKFYNDQQNKLGQINYVCVNIIGGKNNSHSKIQIVVQKKNIPEPFKNYLQLNQKLIPHDATDPAMVAKKLLQKKFWILLSADLNIVSVNINDYYHLIDQKDKKNQYMKHQPILSLGLEEHNSWQNQIKSFPLKSSSNSPDYKKDSLYDLDTLEITYEYQRPMNISDQECYNLIKDCHKVKMIQINRILNPILSQNPSILGKDGNQELLSQQIRVLYEYLRTLSINQLPKYVPQEQSKQKTEKQPQKFDINSYNNWRCFKTAIDQSIKTKPGYIQIKRSNQDQIEKQPIGLMNALMLVKSIDISEENLQNNQPDFGKVFRWTQFDWKGSVVPLSIEERMKFIYQQRQTYIRLELLDHQGIGPGSMAVLQVWPPHCCSPIHNHGQSYGLIKVLTNQICVENYNDLNFSPQDLKPYQRNIYQQGQYTWLSEYSYGIHRLVNPTSHTTLSLQAYMGDKGTKEYFEFIEYEKDHQQYMEYYPQNDWRNFLNWPEIIGDHWKGQKWIQDLIEYIKQVRSYYNLNDYAHQDFPHLVLALKKQSEIYDRLTREQLSDLNKNITVKFQPLEEELIPKKNSK